MRQIKTNRMIKKLITIALLAVSVQLNAQDIVTDRPDQTEAPNAVKPGVLQIESGLLFERYELEDGFSQHRNVFPTNLFRIGLVKNFELRIVNEVVNYKTIDNLGRFNDREVQGTENMQVGFKWQLTDTDSKIVVGLLAHAILPTGSEGISNKYYGGLAKISMSYDLDDRRSLSTNIGYANEQLDFDSNGLVRQSDGAFVYTLAYGHSLSDKIGIYAEVFGNYQELEEWKNNMDAGLTYLIRPNLQFDYSYGWGLNQVMNYHSIGVSIRLPN